MRLSIALSTIQTIVRVAAPVAAPVNVPIGIFFTVMAARPRAALTTGRPSGPLGR